MSTSREKAVNCFTSALQHLKAPEGYFSSPEFLHLRWSTAGEQRVEQMRLFCRKYLRRLDSMHVPLFPQVGLMDVKEARQRYVTGCDPWEPMLSPFLDGSAIRFRHCLHGAELPAHCTALLAEIAFDVARLSQIAIAWHGFSDADVMTFELSGRPGLLVDGRTYGVRNRPKLDYRV